MRRWKAAVIAAGLFMPAALFLTACSSTSYEGISFAAQGADPALSLLARQAALGDKNAQLNLGIRFEEGRGVPVDLGRAQRLYAAAAAESGGNLQIYAPGVGRSGGRVIPVSQGPLQPGLAAAQERLAALTQRQSGLAPVQPPAAAEATMTRPLLDSESDCPLRHCASLRRMSRSDSVQYGGRECGVREEDSRYNPDVGYVATLPSDHAAAVAVATCLIRTNAANAVGLVDSAAGFRWLTGQRQEAVELYILVLRTLVARRASVEQSNSTQASDFDGQADLRRRAEMILRTVSEDGISLTAEERAFVTATASGQVRRGD